MSKVRMITPVDITALSHSWVEMDLSAYVSDDATGVILFFDNNSTATAGHFGNRMHGSTDDRPGVGCPSESAYYCIGLDADKKIDAFWYSTSAKVYLCGYFREEAVFFTNAYSFAVSSAYTWTDVDISSYTGTDTAIAAIFEVVDGNGINFRKNGYSGTVYGQGTVNKTFIVPLDSNEKCEMYVTNVSHTAYLVGYFTKDVTMYNGPTNFTSAVPDDSAWHSVHSFYADPETSSGYTEIPDNSIAVIVGLTGDYKGTKYTDNQAGARKTASGFTAIGDQCLNGHGVIECYGAADTRYVDFFRESQHNGIFLIGYFPNVPEYISAALTDVSGVQGHVAVTKKVKSNISSDSNAATSYDLTRGLDATISSASDVRGRMSELLPIKIASNVVSNAFVSMKAAVTFASSSDVQGHLTRYSWVSVSEISDTSGITAIVLRLKPATGNLASATAIMLGDAVMQLGARVAPAPTSWIRAWIHKGDETMTPKYTFYESNS